MNTLNHHYNFDNVNQEHDEKIIVLAKLNELAEKGFKLPQNYTINSDLKTMENDYEFLYNFWADKNLDEESNDAIEQNQQKEFFNELKKIIDKCSKLLPNSDVNPNDESCSLFDESESESSDVSNSDIYIEEKLEKLYLMRNLGILTERGVRLSQNYNIDSDIGMMRYEYQMHQKKWKEKNDVNYLKTLVLALFHGLKLMCEKYDFPEILNEAHESLKNSEFNLDNKQNQQTMLSDDNSDNDCVSDECNDTLIEI